MLRDGVIMDFVDAAQARIAEEACAVMDMERVPVDIRAQSGVATLKHRNPLLPRPLTTRRSRQTKYLPRFHGTTPRGHICFFIRSSPPSSRCL
ncbi:Pyridoxal biosynthesis protein PDX1.1 [Platanthera zijinensis]|uniref:Pyridoxal biosynthesis protein PDX1.1 n=1 Tax=Platanthera zijinensis TaxID=2320716 RepID=A0AAP0GA58_9ASPA